METESNRNSPLANLVGFSALGHNADYEGNGLDGHDYGFDHGHGLSLDTVIQGGAGGGVGDSNDWNVWSAPANMTENMRSYAHAFDTSLLSSPTSDVGTGPHSAGPSVTSHPTERLTFARHQAHRSTGSTGFGPPPDRHGSVTASDATTPISPRAHRDSAPDIPDDMMPTHEGDEAPSHEPHSADNGKSDDVPPPWSELKTKAGKERKRLPLACIACRRKKIRCSGEKPACKHCLRSRIPCVYKVTTRKAAPRTDYMAMLDKRLKRMEERVIKIIPKEDQSVVSTTGRAVVKPPLPPPPPKPGGSKKRGADQAFGDELDVWASSQPAPINSSQNQQPAQIMESQALKAKHSDEHSLQHEGADKLPSKELQEHLAEVFFDYVYGQSYHLLHKPSFMRKLAQGTVPPVLMLAICAISARFSNHPAVRTEPAFLRGEEWAGPAREIAIKRYDTPTITILIVYMIIGMHEFGTCQGGRSWMLSGMAQRMAYALQLHRDLHHDPRERAGDRQAELSPTDREIRRRTMWACFLMDRFTSSGTERPIFVGEQYISAQLPIKESYFQMEVCGPTENLEGHVPNPIDPGAGQIADAKENMGVAAYVIRLVALWGRLIHYMNLGGKERDNRSMWDEESKFSNLRREVRRWRDTLPPALHYNEENLQNHASEKIANQFLFMHITYHQVLLFMHRFALPMPGPHPVFPSDVPPAFIAEAATIARESANSISTLVHEAVDYQVVVPFVGYAAFFSSTVHIQGAFSKNPQLEASSKQYLAYNVKYLTKIKRHWGMFHFVTENLRDLYRKNADAVRAGGKSNKDDDPGIFQYGDWFDRYPHGVSGTDYEGPGTEAKHEPGSDAVLGQKSDLQTVEEFFAKLTPPSRAVQFQQGPQGAGSQGHVAKKVAKRRRSSKHDRPRPSQSSLAPSDTPDGAASQHLDSPSQPQMTHDLASTQNFPTFAGGGVSGGESAGDSNAYPLFSTAFPPGYRQPHNALLMDLAQQQQATYLTQLDHAMAIDDTGVHDPSNPTAPPLSLAAPTHSQPGPHPGNLSHPGALPTSNGNNSLDFGPYDFTHLANMNQSATSDFWAAPNHLLADHHSSSAAAAAWFMPFNVEPPTIGEDHNLFSSAADFDWGNVFTGFGEGMEGGPIPGPEGNMMGQSVGENSGENLGEHGPGNGGGDLEIGDLEGGVRLGLDGMEGL